MVNKRSTKEDDIALLVYLSIFLLVYGIQYCTVYMRGFKTFFVEFMMPLRPALPSVYLFII